MGNPVVQLSCETKQTGGLTIRHENCNTKHTVPSSVNFICRKIRSNKSGGQAESIILISYQAFHKNRHSAEYLFFDRINYIFHIPERLYVNIDPLIYDYIYSQMPVISALGCCYYILKL